MCALVKKNALVFALGYAAGCCLHKRILEAMQSWNLSRPIRKLFRSSSSSEWSDEACHADVPWSSYTCSNCDYWEEHGLPCARMLHGCIAHVFQVRDNAEVEVRRGVSTSRSGIAVWKRAQSKGEHFFVWDVISSECVLDICRQSQEIWFKEFAMECMKVELSQNDRRVVVEDVQEWSQYLNEVIIDRSQVGIGCVGRKLEKLNLLQMFALWMDWDIMFSELL